MLRKTKTNKTMKTKLLLTVIVAALFAACGPSEKEMLRTEVDSLRQELEASQRVAEKLNEIGVLMDSIDANRQTLRLNVLEGISQDDYLSRMQGLKTYVKNTEDKIEELEKSLKKSKSSNRAFAAAIQKLKTDIELKNQEIASLTETVNKYKKENENLVKINEVQGLDLMDKLQQIETKKQEVVALQNKVDEITENAKQSIAAQYLAHAKSVEEIANKTKFAPKKKKEKIDQSLELYRKAALYGNEQAKADIERLESGLK